MAKKNFLLFIMICIWAIVSGQENSGLISVKKDASYSYEHPIEYSPGKYVCYYTNEKIIVDGKIDQQEWGEVPWTELFVDIEGALKPTPPLSTKAKMTWDDSHFYIAAKMDEPHVWATLTERDAIMFQDDDFEVFIDPDGDGHNYFEFEMNAFNAIWDLFMLYPYYIDNQRNYIMNWDIRGIETAVFVEGTLNNPNDTDEFWSVEIAVPWHCFKDFKIGSERPKEGEQWRVNFSRVDWTMDIVNGNYVKRKNAKTGKKLSENNWVWSPTGYINMHKPEVWGYVQFEKERATEFKEDSNEAIKWALWQLYYQVKDCKKSNLVSCNLNNLTLPKLDIANYSFDPRITQDQFGFTISASLLDKRMIAINNKGRLAIY